MSLPNEYVTAKSLLWDTNIHEPNKEGFTPLMHATQSKLLLKEILENARVMSMQLQVNQADNNDNTCLHYFCRILNSQVNKNNKPETLDILKEYYLILKGYGADIKRRNQEAKTPFDLIWDQKPDDKRQARLSLVLGDDFIEAAPPDSFIAHRPALNSHITELEDIQAPVEWR